MGIRCDACGRVYFIASSHVIKSSRTAQYMYLLSCMPPCDQLKEFRRDAMYPYRVRDVVFKRGYADEDEYELVQKAG